MSFESQNHSDKHEELVREQLRNLEEQRQLMRKFSLLAKKPSCLAEQSRATKLFCIKNRHWLYGFDEQKQPFSDERTEATRRPAMVPLEPWTASRRTQ